MDDILEADQVNGTRPSSVAVFILMLILAASAMSLVCIRRPSKQQSESAIIKTPTSDTKTVTVEPAEEILSIDPQPPGPTLVGSLTVVYPEEVRKAGIQGTVNLRIYVNDKGRVTKVEVADGLHPTLDSTATEAARKCVFLPTIDRGQPIGSWILLPVTFSLQDSPRQNP